MTATARWGWPALAARMADALNEAQQAVPAPAPAWPLAQDTGRQRSGHL